MSTCHRRSRTCRIAGACIAVLTATSAVAADQRSDVLQEIVVTATRHEESLSKVAVSVTAFTQETLDVKGIKDITDAVRFTPGVSVDVSGGGANQISIRGISSSGGAGTTGIYIDDTPIQMRALGYNPDDALPKTFDLDRVEVLRGPQGTLFGSGSEGGTVRYIMTQPSLTKDSTYARSEASFTRGGEPSYEVGVAHGGPLIDGKLGYRASVWYRYDGGWIDRVDPTTRATVDQHANRANTMAARLAFIWQPTDGVAVTPSLMYQNSRKHDLSTWWPAYSNPGAGEFKNGTPERIPSPDEYYLPSLKIEADLGRTRLISNTSYYHRSEQTGYQGSVYNLGYFQGLSSNPDLVYSCGPSSNPTTPDPVCPWYPLMDANGIHLPPGFENYSTPNIMTNRQQSWTQEIRLQSNDEASRWRWTVGAFWSLSKTRSIEELRDPQVYAFWDTIFGISPDDYYGTTESGGSFYHCNGVGTPGQTFPDCDIYYNDNTVHDRQVAGFGEVTYALTDSLKLTVGGRYAKMSFDLAHYADGLENYGPDRRSAESKETSFTPKLGLSYQMDAANLFYATYAKGFRPGGGNPPLPGFCDADLATTGYPGGAPPTYNSDSTQSFEIGSKNNFNNRIRIAASIYYIKWKDIQQNVYVAGNCGLQFTDNLGDAVSKGFDFQAELVLGGGFSLDAAVGYTSARYSKDTILYDTTQNPVVAHQLVSRGNAISGEAAIDYGPGTIPPWTVALGAQYNFAAGGREAYVRLDWEYASRNNWLAAIQDPQTEQYNANTYPLPSTTYASLRGGVTIGKWMISGFVENLFDSRTVTNYALGPYDPSLAQPSSVQQNSFTFRPRTIGLTASYRL